MTEVRSRGQMKFDDPTEPHDIVLIVDDAKFYYSKIHLAKQSDYFKSMFFGSFAEKDKKEIRLNDPESPEEFKTFLKIINAIDCLTDTNVDSILCLSDQWQAPIVREKCLKLLMGNTKKTAKEKFDLALQYGFEELKIKVLSESTTIEKLHEIIPADLSQWNPTTIKTVFERHLKLAGFKPKPDALKVDRAKYRSTRRLRKEYRAQLIEPRRERLSFRDLVKMVIQQNRTIRQQ